MNKAELISKIAEKSGLTKKEAELALNATTSSIVEALSNGEKVAVMGFGSFETKKRAARVARNPRNPEETIEVKECIAPYFKASKNLKEAVNN